MSTTEAEDFDRSTIAYTLVSCWDGLDDDMEKTPETALIGLATGVLAHVFNPDHDNIEAAIYEARGWLVAHPGHLVQIMMARMMSGLS